MRSTLHILLLVCLSLAVSTVSYGQEKIAWTDLSIEQRQILKQLESTWDNLPAERQQVLRRGANRWEQMRPQEKDRAQAQRLRYQNLPQQQKAIISQRFQRFNSLSRPQQQRLRTIQERFQNLPPQQRQEIRERFEERAEAARQERINQQRIESSGTRPQINSDFPRPPQTARPGGALPDLNNRPSELTRPPAQPPRPRPPPR